MSRGQWLAQLPLEKRREFASKGGRIAHLKGLAHEWTRKEASLASLKGWGKLVVVVVSEDKELIPEKN